MTNALVLSNTMPSSSFVDGVLTVLVEVDIPSAPHGLGGPNFVVLRVNVTVVNDDVVSSPSLCTIMIMFSVLGIHIVAAMSPGNILDGVGVSLRMH